MCQWRQCLQSHRKQSHSDSSGSDWKIGTQPLLLYSDQTPSYDEDSDDQAEGERDRDLGRGVTGQLVHCLNTR